MATETGQRLLSALRAYNVHIGGVSYPVDAQAAEEYITAIADEAVLAERKRISNAVAALPAEGRGEHPLTDTVLRARVLTVVNDIRA